MTIKNDNAKAIGIVIAIIALIVASIVASIFSITAMNLVVIALLGYGTFVSLFVVTADIAVDYSPRLNPGDSSFTDQCLLYPQKRT